MIYLRLSSVAAGAEKVLGVLGGGPTAAIGLRVAVADNKRR
jgi:hypothetical protein